MQNDQAEREAFYFHAPYPSAASLNRSYSGNGRGGIRKNAAAGAWLDDVVTLARSAGLKGLRMEEWRLTIACFLWTCGMDVAAMEKALIDAVATAAFGIKRDALGRAIYPDATTDSLYAVKVPVKHRPQQMLEVVVVAEPMVDAHQASLRHRDLVLAMLGVDPPTDEQVARSARMASNRWRYQGDKA